MSESLSNVKAAIPSCAITEEELRDQRSRQARLAPGVADSRREADALVIEFAPGFDREALDGILEVERRCCPFFRFDLDDRERRLRVTVDDPANAQALDALAALLLPAGA